MNAMQRFVARVLNLKMDDPLRYMQFIQHDQPAGVTVTQTNALELSVVWACVSMIANPIASCDWNIYEMRGEKRVDQPNDPLWYILNVRPNPDMTAMGLKESLLFNVLTWGNSYGYIVRDMAQRVKEIWPLLPHRVTPWRDPVSQAIFYDYYEQTGGHVTLRSDEVFHLHGPGITGLMGDNIVARAAKSMSLAMAQERFASTYFGNNTNIGGFLTYPKTMDDATFNHLRDSWADRYKGPDKAHKPAILEGGMTWTPLTTPIDDAQLVNSRKLQIEDICRWYAVPPHKVQHLDRMTYNNVEHLAIEYVRDALKPWTIRMEQEADYKLFSPRSNRRTTFDMFWLMQGDFKTRMEGYHIGRRMGVYSINDVLKLEKQNGIGKEGDGRTIEINMQDVRAVLGGPDLSKPDMIKAGIPTLNEVREQFDLPPIAGGDIPANSLLQVRQPSADPLQQPSDPIPAGEGELPAGSEEGTPAPLPFTGGQPATAKLHNPLNEAVSLLFASVFDRYLKRMENRTADLRRHKSEAQVDSTMTAWRLKQRDVVAKECQGTKELIAKVGRSTEIVDIQVMIAMDAIDNGMASREAADSLTSLVFKGA